MMQEVFIDLNTPGYANGLRSEALLLFWWGSWENASYKTQGPLESQTEHDQCSFPENVLTVQLTGCTKKLNYLFRPNADRNSRDRQVVSDGSYILKARISLLVRFFQWRIVIGERVLRRISPGWLFRHFNSRIGPRLEARYLGKRPKLFTNSELDEQLGEQQEEVVLGIQRMSLWERCRRNYHPGKGVSIF